MSFRLPTPGGIPDPEDNEDITLKAPDGTPIIGVAEAFKLTHCKLSMLSRNEETGERVMEYVSGTENPDWDMVETLELDGQTIYLDAKDRYWLENQLIHVDAPLPEVFPKPLKLQDYGEILQGKVIADRVSTMIDRAIAALDPVIALYAVQHLNCIITGNSDEKELARIYRLVQQSEDTKVLVEVFISQEKEGGQDQNAGPQPGA